ncbi:MAG TPA: hypothetical protein VFW07_25965 [Parafilimonas sp.]|nr:hypothetical protein [Parafilimonas sp.]
MKKIILSVALIFPAMYLMAQDDAVIQLYLSQKQYDKAKGEVDKMVNNPKLKDKDKPNAYLWQMLVYSSLYADSAMSPKYPGADAVALDAFSKYQALDPELQKMKEQHFESGIANVYNGYLNTGNTFWKNKQWDSSFKYFSSAKRLGDVLITNKLTQATGDTTILLFTGYAAQNAQMLDSAASYYGQVADMKLGGQDYEDVYKFLIGHYYQKKDDVNFKKYLAMAKELYPNDNALWTQYEMENMTANSSLTDLLQKYNQEVAAGTVDENKLVGFAQAFESNDSAQLQGLDSAQRIQLKVTAGQAYGKAFDLVNTNGTYAFGAGYYDYVVFEVLDDRYHANSGESAALKSQRAAIAKEQMVYADSSSAWLEKAFAILNAKQDRERNETANLNRTVNYLSNLYLWKRDRTKVDGNSQDYDKYDALYKKYDALYNTFK